MKESLKKRIESIEKKEGSTEKFMYLCGIIGIVDIVFGILSLYLHFWIAVRHLFLNCCEAGYRFFQNGEKS